MQTNNKPHGSDLSHFRSVGVYCTTEMGVVPAKSLSAA